MSVSIDASEMRQFATEVTQGAGQIPAKVRPVIVRGAVQIRDQLRAEMGSSGSFGHLARGISYDVEGSGTHVEAEIGPHKRYTGRRQAPRRGANIAYFGTSKGGGSVPDPQGALDAEAPNIERFLADVIVDLF